MQSIEPQMCYCTSGNLEIPGLGLAAHPGMTRKKYRLRDRSDSVRPSSTGEHSMRKFLTVLAALTTLSLTNCGYNAIQTNDEQVKASWSEVVNQYQRRADLVPNLVNSVKGFAQQEKDVLLGVTNARAKVGSIQATPEVLNDPAAFQKFQAAQGELSGALSRLLVVTENYPQLKSDTLFRDLMSQLEGTENRITVARNRYIKTVQDYNVGIRTFPNNLTAMVFGYKEKPNFSVANEKEISVAPKVDFNPAPAPAAPAK
jgi:LemA protein